MGNILNFFKKHPYPLVFSLSVVYLWGTRHLFSCFFDINAPAYITAPILCVFSAFLTVVLLYFIKALDKKWKKALAFFCIYAFPPLFWYLVSRGAYIWNSYLGGELFYSLSLYITGIENALWGLGMSAASILTVTLYKFVGGKNEDPRNDSK